MEQFITRWLNTDGGQERANYALFLSELCDALGVARPDPASAEHENNDFVFERVVREKMRDGPDRIRRIDLYKRDCFVLEAKQTRLIAAEATLHDDDAKFRPDLFGHVSRKKPGSHHWDTVMNSARAQAENYVRLLPDGHRPPPFVIVCDVGRAFEIYANFLRDGKAFSQFPDRLSFRIRLEELRNPAIAERLRLMFADPMALDPTRHSAEVTRQIAVRVAAVSKSLEGQGHAPETVALFIIRLLFTMFAEDVGLIPPKSFQGLLEECRSDPASFPKLVEELWKAMDEGTYAYAIRAYIPKFNGKFFEKRTALPLPREAIGELVEAARHDWKTVEPAIFGAFLEQALDPVERKRLGAHYTPRDYVARLVAATVMEPLRADFARAIETVDRQMAEDRKDDALATLYGFRDRLCTVRVLDPACGTGNFLYVALAMMKELEGDVLTAIFNIDGKTDFATFEENSVNPGQFLGLEINPRAAAIAGLVLLIGYLQWHFKNRGGPPAEPILKDYKNIIEQDAVLTWDDAPLTQVENGKEICRNPKKPDWPEAEFIVGNPPFIGGKDLRARLGDAYAEALWSVHDDVNPSADFVMYWWHRAALKLRQPGTALRRFGFVTTNSISQIFQRRVIETHLGSKPPVKLLYAIADHPWTKATKDAAAVRIAMTAVGMEVAEGRLLTVESEAGLDTDHPAIRFTEQRGRINADLSVGSDATSVGPLRSNSSLSSRGVSLHGLGFILEGSQARLLIERNPSLGSVIKKFANGRDLQQTSRGTYVIDMFGFDDIAARRKFPEAYQHLLEHVKPVRDRNLRESYRELWWIFGEPRKDIRPALAGLVRYIVTVRTAKHRVFQFLEADVLPESGLVVIADDSPVTLGVLSSKIHTLFSIASGGWLGVGNDPVYNNSLCFDPFPFPDATPDQNAKISVIAEELDAHRKRVIADHPHLTMTGLYNVLEALRAGTRPDQLTPKERSIFDDGLVMILKELHDRLDQAVAEAYGFPADLADAAILSRLVALNRVRHVEEARGIVRWLRPDYQIPRFGSTEDKAALAEGRSHRQDEFSGMDVEQKPRREEGDEAPASKPLFPRTDLDQTNAVIAALVDSDGDATMTVEVLAQRYRQGRRIEGKIQSVLASLARGGKVSGSGTTGYRWIRM